ncbi:MULTISPECIES: ABC transporter substrate-binding protein [unclassified Pseudonocardia]|uniref:ABC transporter substrate-binding protein n=1 Tax=unclassified Pseudonocardia TaxID=2619320 RepID=UPI0001FFE04C|nr:MULTISPECIES: ABC transporter substrate-binding protein [unclassified Pseudonocardia]ALE73414.1 peptide ABC transporter substrate-binding protein [Pseudonocardia sp. EC080625-04]ALL77070.1 peptide ABC transporter substrate-binding protein [Pseudonocardia sp. EC080610-09]ALL84101.1 peptide ABC transporter substrate-binding protein [Pseudonocardia sp. EC080619-01]OLM18436.1 Oligopeptide ABC transporter, periplasmic oligopeptide-binding protein OppA [Pseudonocardia sp. Ae707_Ps1]
MISPTAAPFTRRRLLGGAAGLAAAAFLAGCGGPAAARDAGPPRRGGVLRVGVTGGGASDTLDPHSPATNPDIARTLSLYEPLLHWDDAYTLQPAVAEAVRPDPGARTWTATIRSGITFHDGRPVTPDDVVATFRRITDPDDPKSGASQLGILDDVVVAGDRQVRFVLSEPSPVFDQYLAEYSCGIVPTDFDVERPVGTGAFRFESFAAGQQSAFVRYDGYWRPDQPWVDRLELINFSEDDARINALLSGQVDAIDQVPLSLTEVVGAYESVRLLTSETGGWLPFTMRVDVAPFDDVRVRQALRLIAGRDEMVNQVLSGLGTHASDLYARFDPEYLDPRREQDIERARDLLSAAGKPNLSLELVTSPIQAGAVEAAQVYATQARAAGVEIGLRRVDTSTFFSDQYLQWEFAQSFWNTRNYIPQASQSSMPDAPFNETHWDDAEYQGVIRRARSEVDTTLRAQLVRRAQQIEFDRGGYLIWGYPDRVDAHQAYVGGLVPNRTGLSLSGYEFRKAWVNA